MVLATTFQSFFLFFFGHTMGHSELPRPGFELIPPVLEAQVLATRP